MLETWLRTAEDEPVGGQVTFPLKLFFCDLVGPDAALLQLEAYATFLDRRAAAMQAAAGLPPGSPYTELVLDHGVRRTEATQTWIRSARRTLRSLSESSSERTDAGSGRRRRSSTEGP